MNNQDQAYILKEKLKWRSRRSILELDLFFERFISSGEFNRLTADELDSYVLLLELDDGDLLQLFQGKVYLEDVSLQKLIDKISRNDFYEENFDVK